MPIHRLFPLCVPLLTAACAAPSSAPGEVGAPPEEDPAKAEIPLPAEAGWGAFLLLDNESTGIWTVEPHQVFEQYGCPEVVGLDDLGRCWVLVSYSGKWTPLETVHDGRWLGGLAHGDVDPRVAGSELYTGGQKGNLYQVVPHPHGALDCRLIAHLSGREIHTLLAGDLDPRSPGSELLVFTRPGGLFRVSPTGSHGTFEVEPLQPLDGRIRDALLLPESAGQPPAIATVSRAGRLELLRIAEDGPRWVTLYADPMGMGRVTLRPARADEPVVLYASHDDGRILRLERGAADDWSVETIYLGPQGPRGIAAGRFDPDPAVETVAVFGYSGEVELLTRGESGWRAETIFRDRDKGHWLATAELDGRNATREILCSGYGGRIAMLVRPPGDGREELVREETASEAE